MPLPINLHNPIGSRTLCLCVCTVTQVYNCKKEKRITPLATGR
uniref:Uncharacterized protein n=1 Tax=Arundo donax TaxID=35708 RepID=A0A0A9F8T5_ARUDO